MMYRISCLAHPVSHHPYARPRGATARHKKSRGTTRGATGGHSRQPKSPDTRHGGPRGGTGGHGRQPKSPGTPTAPFNILEDPYKLRLFGEYIYIYMYIYIGIRGPGCMGSWDSRGLGSGVQGPGSGVRGPGSGVRGPGFWLRGLGSGV